MKKLFLIGLSALTLGGCGYGFHGGKSILPPDVKKIYIPIVENDSTEGGLSNIFTESLRDTFERYGAVEVVDNELGADAILKARIVKVTRDTRSVTSQTDQALQLDTTMTVDAELKRTTGSILYRNKSLQVSKSFGASAGSTISSSSDFASGIVSSGDLANLDPHEQQRSQEQLALQDITQRVARKIYDDAVAPDF